MRIETVVRPMLAVLVASAAFTASAEPPNPATAPARNAGTGAHTKAFLAPAGPDAEYLSLVDRFSLAADGTVVQERSFRLKVNTYLAINRMMGESRVEYDPELETLEVLSNRTVLPSGALVEGPANAIIEDLPRDAMGNPLWSQLRRTLIVHTALEPGAVIESSWRRTVKPELGWMEAAVPLGQQVPVAERIVEVEVPAGVQVRFQVTGAAVAPVGRETVSGRDRYRVRLERLPAFPHEPGAPADQDWVPALWLSTCPEASELHAALSRRVLGAGPVPAAVEEIGRKAAAGNASDDARSVAVARAVAERVRVSPLEPSLQHWRARPPADVWRAGVASPLELAALQVGALRAAGIEASIALVGPRERSVQPGGQGAAYAPTLAGFDRVALLVAAGGAGGTLALDPAHPDDRVALGGRPLLSTSGGATAGDPQPSRTQLDVRALIDAKGAITARVAAATAGDRAPSLALVGNASAWDRDLAAVLPRGKVKSSRVQMLSRDGASVVAEIEATLPEADRHRLVELPFEPFAAGLDPGLPPTPGAGRQAPVEVPAGAQESQSLTVELPAGWSVAALPPPVSVSNAIGAFEASCERAEQSITCRRTLRINEREVVPASEAGAVRDLLAAWRAADGRSLLLRPPASK